MFDSAGATPDPENSNTDIQPNMSVFDDEGSKPTPENPQQRSPINPDTFIDPQFANLPKDEAIIRSAQSQIDKAGDALLKAEAKYEESLPVVRAFDQLSNDKEYLRAFVKQQDPEFFEQFSTSNVTDKVKQQLSKKFGADFEPVPEDVSKYGTKSWEYNRAFNKLYDKFSNETPDEIKPLNELLEARKAENKVLLEKRQKDVQQIMKEENWTQDQVLYMLNWAKNLGIFDIKKIFKFSLRNVSRAPSPTEIKGSLPGLPQFQQVTDLFGPPRSGKEFRKA